MQRSYKVGTRASYLALKQVEEISQKLKKFYPEISLEAVKIDTYGDKDKLTPISEIEGSDFFTQSIDAALLKGEIDFAVHSAKDLPDELPRGLKIAAITASLALEDVLISKKGLKLNALSQGARVGTSSLRRKEQLKKYRSDFKIVDIRGTILERLALLDNGSSVNLDAIIIAKAGLMRLGLQNRITQELPLTIVKPHPLQGALALVVKAENKELADVLKVLDKK